MNREAVFVDTSGWYALTDAGDFHHGRATQSLRRSPLRILEQRWSDAEPLKVWMHGQVPGRAPALYFDRSKR